MGIGFPAGCASQPGANMRRPGSMSWAGINNTFFWVDPQQQIGVIVLMQMLPFYDDAAIRVLQGVEGLVAKHVN